METAALTFMYSFIAGLIKLMWYNNNIIVVLLMVTNVLHLATDVQSITSIIIITTTLDTCFKHMCTREW